MSDYRRRRNREYSPSLEKAYTQPYSKKSSLTRPPPYSPYFPSQTERSSQSYDEYVPPLNQALMNTRDLPVRPRSRDANSPTKSEEHQVLFRDEKKLSERDRKRKTSLSEAANDRTRRSWSKGGKRTGKDVFIETLTVPSNSLPLDTHFRNVKGNVHIQNLRIEDHPVPKSKKELEKDKIKLKRRKAEKKKAEKEEEKISKLTRACELATVVGLVLQWKEYKRG